MSDPFLKLIPVVFTCQYITYRRKAQKVLAVSRWKHKTRNPLRRYSESVYSCVQSAGHPIYCEKEKRHKKQDCPRSADSLPDCSVFSVIRVRGGACERPLWGLDMGALRGKWLIRLYVQRENSGYLCGCLGHPCAGPGPGFISIWIRGHIYGRCAIISFDGTRLVFV